jgi:ribonucleoside-diphosphate reductase alpha subunit
MFMRVAIGIHKTDIEAAIETYDLMSRKYFTHATPTLYNAGTPFPQMSSCFLLEMLSDSIEGIYGTLSQCAVISKSAGGIGISCSSIRAKGSYIRGTNGTANGIVPMLRVFNDTARYVDQGGGKRKGSFAVYIEPWHADVFEFLELRRNTGKEENRARDLFYGLWIPDLFMRRVVADAEWTLMCPNECPGLPELWGPRFDSLYAHYERAGMGRRTLRARELWQTIIDAQIETGTPYMLFKDACNRKSNQQNLGTIKGSNLCTEVVQFTSPEEVAVCNLASVSLPAFLRADRSFDFDRLIAITRIATRNLNRIIDINHYPVPEARRSNLRHRPIGIGVQGLADVFQKMGVSFESNEAAELNERIFESIYFGAVTESIALAKVDGPYESFAGSPASKGQLQFDLWEYAPTKCGLDWAAVKAQLRQYGMRNSLLVAPMPTASTSQILGNNETFEPYTANVYTRRVLAGEFVCVNRNLIEFLIAKGLWTAELRKRLIAANGSVQSLAELSAHDRDVFKTVWEISQKSILNLALGRSPFVDQSQSLNIHLAEPTYSKMCSVHFYAWEKGLKTGMYYLRSRPAADPIKFTIDAEFLLKSAGEMLTKEDDSGAIRPRSENGAEDAKPKKRMKPNDGAEEPKLKVCPLHKPGTADYE